MLSQLKKKQEQKEQIETNNMIGNEKAWSTIDSWFSKSNDRREPKVLLLIGPPGIGKSSGIELLCKKYEYHKSEINASDVRTSKEICYYLSENIIGRSLFDLKGFENAKVQKPKKIAIVLDELDGVFDDYNGSNNNNSTILTKKRKINMELVQPTYHSIQEIIDAKNLTTADKIILTIEFIYNNFNKNMNPIIFIANNHSNLTIKTLKKISFSKSYFIKVISFYRLTNNDLQQILNQKLKESKYVMNDYTQKVIIVQSNGDARALLNTFTLLKNTSQPLEKVTNNKITTDVRDGTLDFFQSSLYLLTNYKSDFNTKFHAADVYYLNNPFLMICMIHENYLESIPKYKIIKCKETKMKKELEIMQEIRKISNMISFDITLTEYKLYNEASFINSGLQQIDDTQSFQLSFGIRQATLSLTNFYNQPNIYRSPKPKMTFTKIPTFLREQRLSQEKSIQKYEPQWSSFILVCFNSLQKLFTLKENGNIHRNDIPLIVREKRIFLDSFNSLKQIIIESKEPQITKQMVELWFLQRYKLSQFLPEKNYITPKLEYWFSKRLFH